MKFNNRLNHANQGLTRLIQDAFVGLEDLGDLFANAHPAPSQPKADVFEDDHHYHLVFELPGVAKPDMKIDLAENQLNLTASVSKQTGDGRKNFELKHRIALPDQVGDGEITAKLEDGLLTVSIPKAEEVKPRTIEIQ